MNILAVSGSKRKNGNTASLLRQALKPFQLSDQFTTETLFLGELDFDGCSGCEGCAKTNRCVVQDDMQRAYDLLRKADALIIGSPTYFYNVTSDMKKFIDRCYCFTSYDRDNRSIWTSEFDSGPRRFAGLISVCEQNNVEDMGVTPRVLQLTFESLGYRTIFNQKVLHAFKQGEVEDNNKVMDSAEANGQKLMKAMLLQRTQKL